ncbi:MAG TPA: hypothetical protein ENI55_01860, partial [Alphaproteobacteria bacterium]|nr:hypothetical protein [Alphaproteobacteria bacterium]
MNFFSPNEPNDKTTLPDFTDSSNSSDAGFVQLAQAAAAAAATEAIGRVAATDGLVEDVHADGGRVDLAKGDPIFQGDTIETGKGAAIGITFVDDSTFSLGGNGQMTIDKMVYDPEAHSGVMKSNMALGVFSFVSGQIARSAPDAMTVQTPVATIGIRGTKVAGVAAPEGQPNSISLLPEVDASGNTFVGELSVSNSAGTVTLNQTGATVRVFSAFTPPPPVTFSPAQIQQQYSVALATLPPSPP